MPVTIEGVHLNKTLGQILCLLAICGAWFRFTGPLFTLFYARQFFVVTQAFTNHDYFFLLLMTITSFSNASDSVSVDWFITKKSSIVEGYTTRRYGIILLRAQVSNMQAYMHSTEIILDAFY